MKCSVDTLHKRVLLEAFEEEARENDFVMPQDLKSKLFCARCQDAFWYLRQHKQFYPKYRFNSWLYTIRLNWKLGIGRVRQAYQIAFGKAEILPGCVFPTTKRSSDERSLRSRQEFNEAAQSIMDRVRRV